MKLTTLSVGAIIIAKMGEYFFYRDVETFPLRYENISMLLFPDI